MGYPDYEGQTGVIGEVRRELERATEKFAPFHSAHEGFAILLEEVEELKHEVFHGTRERARAKAIQIAAMALRFIRDVSDLRSDVP